MTVPIETFVGVALALGIGIVLLLVGIRLGMLAAPRLSRWAEREDDEDSVDGPDA